MFKLLHISDLHFGPFYRDKVGEAVQRLASEAKPDVIVVSGDFTQRAESAQFAQAKAYLDRLPNVPRVVVPGNHDLPLYRVMERFRDPHGLYREFISAELDSVSRFDGAVIVGLDSTAPRRAISNGRIHERQLDFCREAFSDTRDECAKIVVTHHHFASASDDERDQVLPKAERAMRQFIEMGVDLILGGHLHRSFIGDSLDLFPSLRSGHQGIVIVQCGTTTSSHGRGRESEGNSLNVIEVTADLLHVTHYLYYDDEDRFESVSNHSFPRRGIRLAGIPHHAY